MGSGNEIYCHSDLIRYTCNTTIYCIYRREGYTTLLLTGIEWFGNYWIFRMYMYFDIYIYILNVYVDVCIFGANTKLTCTLIRTCVCVCWGGRLMSRATRQIDIYDVICIGRVYCIVICSWFMKYGSTHNSTLLHRRSTIKSNHQTNRACVRMCWWQLYQLVGGWPGSEI